MLPGVVPQGTFRLQAQAQYRRTQPIGAHHLGGQAIALRVKRFDLQVRTDPALARQAPTLLALRRAQGFGLLVVNLTLATHQARMATAGPATEGHGHAIQQVAAEGYRPVAFADVQFRHIKTQS